MEVNGFPPIVAIFYAEFHPTKGPNVLCQVPDGSIVPPLNSEDSSALKEPLIQFDDIKSYVIPKPPLCNRLVSCRVDDYVFIGHPVSIPNEKYPRNSFVFNFTFLFNYDPDVAVYETSIRRLARMFMALEEQSRFLSSTTDYTNIGNIVEQIYQDLNNYSECMIPIDESNMVNMKLFPLFPSPPELKSYHVPISTVRLQSLIDENWDPTMEKIVAYIDGINTIRTIADLADADFELTHQCIQHLLHYGCVIITDLFQFSNIYAPTAQVTSFLTHPDMFYECQAYVFSPGASSFANRRQSHGQSDPSTSLPSVGIAGTSPSSSSVTSNHSASLQAPSQRHLFYLYRSLHQGITLHDWTLEHRRQLVNIDIRRLISFGVLKGLIYRVYSYPLFDHSRQLSQNSPSSKVRDVETGTKTYSLNELTSRRQSFIHKFDNAPPPPKSQVDPQVDKLIDEIIKAPQHFDSICTELRMQKHEVERLLQAKASWSIVNA